MVSDNNLFHAAAWNRYYALARGGVKTEEEHTRMASYVLLSALAVPVISSSAPGTGNMNRSRSDFILGDQETRSRTGRLTSLLGLSRTPTRAGLLKEALNRNILKRVKPELRELYNILEVEFHPLSICAKIEPIIEQIAQDPEMAKYVKPLHSVILTRLFQQLSQVYDSVKLQRVMQLVSAFKAPYNYTPAEIEKFVLNACKKGHLDIRVDHVEQAITFQDDPFEAESHPSAQASTSTSHNGAATSAGSSSGHLATPDSDAVRLQSTPSELVRTQLSRLATCLDTTLKTIDPNIVAAAQEAKQSVFARAVAVAEEEHKAAIARKVTLARRKELLERRAAERDQAEATAKAARVAAAAAAEQTRMAEETKRREQERIKKELEQQIEKEKRELAERLRIIHRRIDHMERAYRREEIPLIGADYERQKAEDREYHKLARKTLLETSKEKHEADLELKKRLSRVLPDYHELRKVIEGKRLSEVQERKKRAQEQIEIEKQKRRVQVQQEREEQAAREEEERRLEAEEAEKAKLREEEEARLAEERRLQEEKEKELESVKRAEIEARQAKLKEQAEKQRQREQEIEDKMKAREAEKRQQGAAPSATTSNDSPWRGRAAAGAVADARASPSPAPPTFVKASGAGGWRERLAQRQAAGESSPADGATPPRSASGAPTQASSPSGSPAPESRRPTFLGRSGAGGWREKEAARLAAGGSSPAAAVDGHSEPNSGNASPAARNSSPVPPTASAAASSGAGADDGFTEVKPIKKSYVPPALRNRS
ncbi:hypothetical protein L7F22_007080 [Adiantum nelumboides]|nr:hypothetical protein [Adiantum nelumboides]